MRYTTLTKLTRSWWVLFVVVAALSVVVVFAPSVQAAAPAAADAPGLEQRQVFNDDLRVRSDETIDGDVTVFRGDVTVEQGGAILGSVIVYNGDIEVKEGGVVSGDIASFSGDVEIDGAVNGSITALSGDVRLGREAVVGGDISVVSGEVKQDRGAVVQGNVLRGSSINLDLPSMAPLTTLPGMAIAAAPAPRQPSLTEIFFEMVWRVVRAVLMLALVAGVAVALLTLRPAWVEETRAILVDRTALSFAAGLIANLFGLALIGLLWLTVCFRPPAVVLGILFTVVNLAGLAAVGDEIGRKIEQRIRTQWQRPWRPVVGVVAPGAIIAFLWVLGSCFSFFAYLGALVLTSLGVGAILVKVLKLGEPTTPAPLAPAAAKPDVTMDDAGDGVTAPATAMQRSTETQVEPPLAETQVEPPLAETQVEPPLAETQVEPPLAETQVEPPLAETQVEPPVEIESTEVIEPEAPVDVVSERPAAAPDDFTQINGIGPVFDQRLKAAGVTTFAELAARTPAEIAEIIQWSQARVERSEIIEQARKLAG
jgi:predicted flap endonuclease-1-like 5' DNA nuclease/cytoskeletal protein CcmA (bactofilin family)